MYFIEFSLEAGIDQDGAVSWETIVYDDCRGVRRGQLAYAALTRVWNQFHGAGGVDYNSLLRVIEPCGTSFVDFGVQGWINQDRFIRSVSWKALYHNGCGVRADKLRTPGERYGNQENWGDRSDIHGRTPYPLPPD